MEMEIFEYTELTFASDKVDDDGQRIKIFRINIVLMETFHAYNMPLFWLKRKDVGRRGRSQCLCHRVPSLGSLFARDIDSSVTGKVR